MNAGRTFYRSRFGMDDVNFDLGDFVCFFFNSIFDFMRHYARHIFS